MSNINGVHLPPLIEDLGLILVTAAVVALVFKKLKQPVVLGYLVAGFLVGPAFPYIPTVKDTESISIWAEVGVIFMLFGLGLEFSFRRLVKVGKSASITASFEVLSMLGVGFLVGQLLGWSKMDSLFLGGILSISSTTIIVRAFEELGLKGEGFVSLVFGILVVEDLIAIVLLVFLSSMAVTQSLSGSDLAQSSLRLVFFLVLWFLLGIYLLPILLRRFRDFLSDEMMLIVSIGLCLMMVIVASYSGFSPALGAFVMGSILAETSEGHHIERIILPVKDLFSAVFFVSVGMLIDLQVLKDYFWVIVLMTFITIIGKFLSTALGALVSGVSVRQSVLSGMSLSQIGEFSFIIATLGMTLKVTSDFLYPIAVSVSAVTTFTTPYLIKIAGRFSDWVERRLPERLSGALVRYEKAMSAQSKESILSILWREYGIKVLLNMVVVIGITLAVKRLALPIMGNTYRGIPVNFLLCATTLLLSAPFLWTIFFGKFVQRTPYSVETLEMLRYSQLGVSIVKFTIGCGLAAFVVSNFTSMLAASGIIFVSLSALGAFFFSRFSDTIYKRIEDRFVSNLTENERKEIEKKATMPQLTPWDATLSNLVISQNSPLVAKTLVESGIRKNFGITIAMIERGESRIVAPDGEDLLLPCDRLYVIGTEEQIRKAREVIEAKPKVHAPFSLGDVGLTSMILTSRDNFIHKTIRDCGLREAVSGLIVGIERAGRRYLNPDSSMELLPGDLVWLVGDKSLIKKLHTA